MSYARWKDERYWHLFRDALKREHPHLTDEGLMKAKEFNAQRYYYDIDTPLKQFVVAHENLVRHCRTIHAMVGS